MRRSWNKRSGASKQDLFSCIIIYKVAGGGETRRSGHGMADGGEFDAGGLDDACGGGFILHTYLQ